VFNSRSGVAQYILNGYRLRNKRYISGEIVSISPNCRYFPGYEVKCYNAPHKVLHKQTKFSLSGFRDPSVHRNMSFVRFWLVKKLAELADEPASWVRGQVQGIVVCFFHKSSIATAVQETRS